MTIKWIELEGNHYEIGYGLGREWGRILNGSGAYWKGWKCEIEDELKWKSDYRASLALAVESYPEIAAEIHGMSDGARESGLDASFLNVYACVMGEAKLGGCSSAVVRLHGGQKTVLAHNEEWLSCAGLSPLLFARVSLKRPRESRKVTFLSVSYPMQLLGSVAGMNSCFAFQGNSIGTHGKNMKCRKGAKALGVPNTFFARRILEIADLESVRKEAGRHYWALPRHHYVCTASKAVSLGLAPAMDGERPSKQVRWTPLDLACDEAHCHTNHLLVGDEEEIDKDWTWGKEEEDDDSLCRRNVLRKQLEKQKPHRPLGVLNAMRWLAKRKPKSKRDTLASLIFTLSGDKPTCSGTAYFPPGGATAIPRKSLKRR